MQIVKNAFNSNRPKVILDNLCQVNLNIRPGKRQETETVEQGFYYDIVLFDETEIKYKSRESIIETATKFSIIARSDDSLQFNMSNADMIKKEANIRILEVYPIYKQINISNLIGYTPADKAVMLSYIENIRQIVQNALANKTDYANVEW